MIEQQVKHTHHYKNYVFPTNNGISIEVRNNAIERVTDGIYAGRWPVRKKQFLQMIQNCLRKHTIHDVVININMGDFPVKHVFNFCRKIGDNMCFLIPNHRFTMDDTIIDGKRFDTYDTQKQHILRIDHPFRIKYNKIYMNCQPHTKKTEYFKYALQNSFCEGFGWVGSVHGNVGLDQETVTQLIKQGLCGKNKVEWENHLYYKYLLYMDGETLSDRMRLLLCTNSVIIQYTSLYEEFYSYKLRPNVHYIECTKVDDLKDIYDSLENDTELCHTLIRNNSEFITNELTYDQILLYLASLLNALSSGEHVVA